MAAADPKIHSNLGWGQLTYILGRKVPRRLHSSGLARKALRDLTKGR